MGDRQDNSVNTFYFLNKVYTDTSDKVIMSEVLINKELDRAITSVIMSLEMLQDIYRESLTNPNTVVDFEVKDGFLKCDTIPRIPIKDVEMYRDIIGEKRIIKPLLATIYDLFDLIIECNGLLVNSKIAEDTSRDIVDLGVVRFLPTYSQSTMTCFISMKIEDEWKSLKLIYTEEGRIQTGKFVFAIPKRFSTKFDEFKLEVLGETVYNKDAYILYKYNDTLPTLAYNMDDVKVLPSICNKYTFMSEVYKQILRASKFIVTSIVEGLYGAETEPDFKTDRKDYASKYTDGYVTFKLRYNALKNEEIQTMVLDCLSNIVPKVYAKEMGIGEIVEYVRSKYTSLITRSVYVEICKILVNGGNAPLDRLDYANNLIGLYKIRKYKVDTLLYMMRVGFFIIPVKLEYGDQAILRGSDAPYTTLLERRK